MANRILRDWTQSENVNKLSVNAEVFFTRLIMKADDYGCFYGNLKLLKSALFPLKDISETEIYNSLRECENNGLIISYVAENKDYVKIMNFGQRLRNMKSKFPQPIVSDLRSIVSKSPPETEVETEVEKKQKRNEDEVVKKMPKNYDEAIELLKSSQIWIESICMLHQIDFNSVSKALDMFKPHRMATGKEFDNLDDFKIHFNNWLRKVDKSQFKTKTTKKEIK